MSKEIERKFLVVGDSYLPLTQGAREIEQGYLQRDPRATVRVRVADGRGFLTVKGRNSGATRDEWEYEIPACDARQMLQRCATGSVISKTRYLVPFGGLTWEVDVFHGSHQGLRLAEVELPAEDTTVALPPFVGEEVTGNPAYYNSNL